MNHHQKGIRVSKLSRSAKAPSRRIGRAFATRGASSVAKGTGAPSRRRTPFVLTSLAAALVLLALALFASPALAAETHVFKEAFGEAGSGDGQLALAEHSGVAVNQTTHNVYVADNEAFFSGAPA